MGQGLSRAVGFFIKRPAQRYNVEHRAQKVIKKIEDEKAPPMRAPMFESDKQLLEYVRKTQPNLTDSMKAKDAPLYSRLRDVYVTSTGDNPEVTRDHPDRPLPKDREQYSYEFVPANQRVPSSVTATRGKISLNEAIQMLTEHSNDPEKNTNKVLAEKYKINPDSVEQTLKHFKLFNVYTPPEKSEVEPADPLAAGKDWVEDVKQLSKGSQRDIMKERREHLKKLEQLNKARADSQRQISDQ